MAFADLLIDLAAVAKASRSVASKHVALRARQVDRYAKTSSILVNTRTVREHTQRQEPELSTTEGPQTGSASGGLPAAKTEAIPHPETRHESPTPQSSPGNSDPASRGEFVSAPWANGITGFTRGPGPGPGVAPALRRSPIETPIIRARKEDDSGLFGPKEEINVSVFQEGGRRSSILRALEETEKEPKLTSTLAEEEMADQVGEMSDSLGPAPGAEVAETQPVSEPVEVFEKVAPLSSSPLPASPEAAAADTVSLTFRQQGDINIAAELSATSAPTSLAAPEYELRESRVPSSRISRLWNYGGLAAGMFAGAIGEGLSRAVGGGSTKGESVMLSPANMERLVAKLSRMRGAALKLGQMMSFQDAKMLPGPIQEVLQRVQDRADYMPAWQRDSVMKDNLGSDWRELFYEFDEKPIAAASIGQVHRATLRSNCERVAVKIQFPGVADSINSDLDNISILLGVAKLMPKGLYLNKTIDNARTELAWECDYEREAQCAARYRELLTDEDEAIFVVPKIYPEASGKHVLTMEFMDGVGVTRVNSFTQEQRDWIGTQILRLCLREIVDFKFMQTDPNWTNFLYNAQRDRLELLDFGASREYPDHFITLYVRLLEAASRLDRSHIKRLSEELGYLTGHESKTMLDAHITSVTTLAEPFLHTAPDVYDFSNQTITDRVKAQIPVMIYERLAPPPEETYSLHRKLSGAFLLCARLGSKVRCRELFEHALAKAGIPRG